MNEVELINSFAGSSSSNSSSSSSSSTTFLCVVFKILCEGDRLTPTICRVLERIGPRGFAAHLRTFADFLIAHFSALMNSQDPQLGKYGEVVNQMIWKLNIFSLDRLVLVLALRYYETNEAQVCFFVILTMLKSSEFTSRVNDLVKDMSPQHWMQDDWHEKHLNFHQKYP